MMHSSNNQVKKKVGRPLKSGTEPQSSAARSREYRRRKSGLLVSEYSETQRIKDALTAIVVATSKFGKLDPNVSEVLEQSEHVIKSIKDRLGFGYETMLYKDVLLKSLNDIAEYAAQTSFDNHMRKTDRV